MGAIPIFLIIALLLYDRLSVIWGLVLTTIIVGLLKIATNQFPENSIIFQMSRRPKGATCCDLLSFDSTDQSQQAGFPSGHMAFISYFIMCLPNNTIPQISFNFALWILIAYDRMATSCHTFFQVIIGTVVGIGVNRLI